MAEEGGELSRSGGCQCGAVRYVVTALKDDAHVCHCRMCQKATGNLFAALVGTAPGALTFTRGTPATFRSSDHVDRGFCAACGTPLFYRYRPSGHVSLMMGTFDDPATLPPLVEEAGCEGRLPHVAQLSGLPRHSTEEQMEDAPAIAASNRQHPDHD
ncbi:GFA family protein [Pseudoroseicyclus tamaricis]|uniref:GFA family protein n=1 Tax=Pseudoroseicyclus tamaricis TaxID=2705421 RepID=A0A6B2JU83_9RHOB|nr:GFA family protein [Pseudoroseicyclus tamaricis]NDV01620.1 GFA family protein [Pseudoroseicyclus tamaricis]